MCFASCRSCEIRRLERSLTLNDDKCEVVHTSANFFWSSGCHQAALVGKGVQASHAPRPAAFGVRQGVTYRPRDLPIISFANSWTTRARDPFDLLDEIEQSLAVASRRRQNHIDREIAGVWRDDSARGQSHSARRARRRARLGWMSIERGHGISVSEAMMSFEHGTRLQSAREPGPPGFQRGSLPRANRGRQPVMVLDATEGPGGKPESSRRSAGCAACRSSSLPTGSTARTSTRSISHSVEDIKIIVFTLYHANHLGWRRQRDAKGIWRTVDKQLQPKGEILL